MKKYGDIEFPNVIIKSPMFQMKIVVSVLIATWMRVTSASQVDFCKIQAREGCTLERFGPSKDGGYLLCRELLDKYTEVVYNYGIQGRDEVGCELATKFNVSVYQFDCYDLRIPPCKSSANTHFTPTCVGTSDHSSGSPRNPKVWKTVHSDIGSRGHLDRNVLLMIDVEGDEYKVIESMSSEVFKTISQLSVEFHRVKNRRDFSRVLDILDVHFAVMAVHCNNHALNCDVVEVLFAKRTLMGPPRRAYLKWPLPLDRPCAPGPEQVWPCPPR